MNNEEKQRSGPVDTVVAALDRVHARYERVSERGRAVSPVIVRLLEIVLAIALFLGLGYWIYLFFAVG